MSTEARDELFERERERGQIEAAVQRLGEGRGGVLVAEGPPGLGKTRLLAEATEEGHSIGARILSARCGELERGLPFGVVRQLLEGELRDEARRADLLQGSAAPAAAAFELGDETSAERAESGSFAVLHGLYWLTLGLAEERPLILVVDDLHWCDLESLRFLSYLARRLEGSAVLIATSLRTREEPADVLLVADITEDPVTTKLAVGELGPDSAHGFVQERLGTEAERGFSDACHAATAGNPLLLEQLLAALDAEGVEPVAASSAEVARVGARALSRSVSIRIQRISDTAVAVAEAVALLGESASQEAVVELAGIDAGEAATAVAALADAEVLGNDSRPRFVHPLVREAVYNEMPTAQRALRHHEAAQVLERLQAPADSIVAQILHAPPQRDEHTARLLREAGRAAMRRGAADAAAAYLNRSLEEVPDGADRAGLMFELGVAETLSNGPRAIPHLREAHALARDPERRALVANVLARTLLYTGSTSEGAELAERARRELPPGAEDLARAFDAVAALAVFFDAGSPEALARLAPFREGIDADGVGARMQEAVTAIAWAYQGGPADRCADLALAALADGALPEAENGMHTICATVTLTIADRPEALDVWDHAMSVAHTSGSLFGISSANVWRGFALYRQGELAEAEESVRSALHDAAIWGFGKDPIAYCAAYLTSILVLRGELAEAREVMDASVDPGEFSDGGRYRLDAMIELLVAEGRGEEAIELAGRFAKRYAWITNPEGSRYRSLIAPALVAGGREDEARAGVEAELEAARIWGAPSSVGRALRALGELGGAGAMEHLAESVEVLDGSIARLELARSLVAYGTALRLSGSGKDAREPLRRGLELATACGAAPLAEQARTELYATGARPRREALSGPESLTPSELRVAELAAAGQTNREIAQQLFVTPKTVEVHLSSVYRKLGISSRRQLTSPVAG